MFNNRDIKIILSEMAREEYKKLNKIVYNEKKEKVTSSFHQTLLRSINRIKELLKLNPFAGNQIQKKLIPREYIKDYGIDNLWRIELANHWRLLYSITGNQIEVVCFVLEISDHKKYNKLLGYKT